MSDAKINSQIGDHVRELYTYSIFDGLPYYNQIEKRTYDANEVARINCIDMSRLVFESLGRDSFLKDAGVSALVVPFTKVGRSWALSNFVHAGVLLHREKNIIGLCDPVYGLIDPLKVNGQKHTGGRIYSLTEINNNLILKFDNGQHVHSWQMHPDFPLLNKELEEIKTRPRDENSGKKPYTSIYTIAKTGRRVNKLGITSKKIRYRTPEAILLDRKLDAVNLEELTARFLEDTNRWFSPVNRSINEEKFYEDVSNFMRILNVF
jgi:hypothetical protein